jgi:hypothetical protein
VGQVAPHQGLAASAVQIIRTIADYGGIAANLNEMRGPLHVAL